MNTKATVIDNTEENSFSNKWEEVFSEVLDNKNLSVKDVETLKFAFYKGGEALLELLDEIRPAANNAKSTVASIHKFDGIKEEIKDFLEEDEEDQIWIPIKATHEADS